MVITATSISATVGMVVAGIQSVISVKGQGGVMAIAHVVAGGVLIAGEHTGIDVIAFTIFIAAVAVLV